MKQQALFSYQEKSEKIKIVICCNLAISHGLYAGTAIIYELKRVDCIDGQTLVYLFFITYLSMIHLLHYMFSGHLIQKSRIKLTFSQSVPIPLKTKLMALLKCSA